MANIQKYGSFTVEDAEAVAEEASRGSGGGFLTLDARTVVRLLPAKLGQRAIVTAHQHFVKLAGMEKGTSINCPRMMAKRACLVCQYAERLKSTGNQADYSDAEGLYPRKRNFAIAINRKEPEMGPQILAFGKTVLDALVDLRTDEDVGGDFTDPDSGFDIIIKKKGSGLKTEYTVAAGPKGPLSEDPDEAEAWLDSMPNLTHQLRVLSDEEIIKACGSQLMSAATSSRRVPVPQGRSAPRSAARAPARTAEDDMDETEET